MMVLLAVLRKLFIGKIPAARSDKNGYIALVKPGERARATPSDVCG